jgi:hypothetical protein
MAKEIIKPRFRLKRDEPWFAAMPRWERRVGFRYADRCCALCRFYEPGYEGEGDCTLPGESGIRVTEPDEEVDEPALFSTSAARVCDFFSPYVGH